MKITRQFQEKLHLYLLQMTYEANKEKVYPYSGCNSQSSFSIRFKIEQILVNKEFPYQYIENHDAIFLMTH